MAIGDDAQDEGMALVPANGATGSPGKVRQGWQEINRTRDYIAQFFNAAKAYADAAVAAISLSWTSITGKPSTFPPSSHTHDELVNGGNVFEYEGSTVWGTDGRLRVGSRADFGNHIYVPNATPTSGVGTIAYIDNSDGKISKGASSERYKTHITPLEALSLGDIFPDLFEFVMRADPDQVPRVGWIAERLHENPATRRFVIYTADENAAPDSVDFIGLLIAHTANLHARVSRLEAERDA